MEAIVDSHEQMKRFFIKYGYGILTGLIFAGYIVLGLFSEIFLYYFGLIFFLGGFYCGAFGPKLFGLIFVLSHGGVGLSLMVNSLCESVFKNPRYTDVPNFMTYVGIVIFIFLFATIFLFILNIMNPLFKDKPLGRNKWYSFIPLSLYLLGLFLIVYFKYQMI